MTNPTKFSSPQTVSATCSRIIINVEVTAKSIPAKKKTGARNESFGDIGLFIVSDIYIATRCILKFATSRMINKFVNISANFQSFRMPSW